MEWEWECEWKWELQSQKEVKDKTKYGKKEKSPVLLCLKMFRRFVGSQRRLFSSSTSPSSSSGSSSPPSGSSSRYVVENSGSTARDHLANERTFLAWTRTGLALVGLGVGIDGLQRAHTVISDIADNDDDNNINNINNNSMNEKSWKKHAPATALVMTGGSFVAYATHRFYHVQKLLLEGKFPMHKGMTSIVIAISLICGASLVMTLSDTIVDTSVFAPNLPQQQQQQHQQLNAGAMRFRQ